MIGKSPFEYDVGWDTRKGGLPLVEIGQFTKIPNRFFSSGTASKIGQSASLLYLALCENANRNGENTFSASDRALASETGLSPRTIRDARITLAETGLIRSSREPGRSYVYTLLPLELKWVRLENRPRQKQRPRASAVAR